MLLGGSTRHLENYPKHWNDNLVNSSELRGLGVRFRAAKSFEAIQWKQEMSSETGQGYSSMVRLMLVYTAYERFSEVLGLTSRKKQNGFQKAHGGDEVVSAMRDSEKGVCNLMRKVLHDTESNDVKREVSKLLKFEKTRLSIVAKGLRHGIAHGWLAPGSNKQDPVFAADCLNRLCEYLLRVMDEEITEDRMRGASSDKRR